MRTSNIFFTLVLMAFYLSPALAQFDDLYFDRARERKLQNERAAIKNQNNNLRNQQSNDLVYDEYYGHEFDEESEYYSDYDYAYSSRIRRFHTPQPPLRYYSSFDYWYNDYYYDPFYDNAFNVNVFIGTPVFGFNRWNRWNSFNSWNYWGSYNRWNRWNRWNSWDAWGYNDPWGWNSYGWNSWNYCPPVYGYYGGNVYYTNVYNTNYYNNQVGNNNGGWGSNGVANNIINKSRRDGALVTPTSGRNTTRRITGQTGDPNPQNDPIRTNDRLSNDVDPVAVRPTNRIYRGDIKNSEQGVTPGMDTRRRDDGISEPPTQRNPVRTPSGRTDDENVTTPRSDPRDTRTPDTRTPDTRTPDVRTPSTRTPETRTPETRTPETTRDRNITPPSSPTQRNERSEPSPPRNSNPNRSDDRMESTSPRSSSQSRSGGGNESASPRSSSSGRSGGSYESSGSGSRSSSSGGNMNSSGSGRSSGSSSGSSGSNRTGSSPRGGG